MGQPKHTPGPWIVDSNYPSDVLADACAIVIQDRSINIDSAEVHANARLIAAAPELLVALSLMIEVYKVDNQSIIKTAVLTKAYNAINKAVGGVE